jgi:hypothetical protein
MVNRPAGFMIALLMDLTRLPPAAPPRHLRDVGDARGVGARAGGAGGGAGDGGGGGQPEGGRERAGRRRRMRRAVLTVLAVLMALVSMVAIGLGKMGGARQPAQLLVGAAAGIPAVKALAESPRLALPGATAANRFDSGWAVRRGDGGVAMEPLHGTGRLLVVHLGEETERVLELDLAAAGLPDGEPVSVRTGERELARGVVRATALPLRLRLPTDLPVGQVPLDVLFGAATVAQAARVAPVVRGATVEPALPAGSARVEGADVVQEGNCLVYVPCELRGNEALVGTFVPPAAARAGQRFDLSVERTDGTPIRRFHWVPSFWNRLRGSRRFELPLRGTTGMVRVRLISHAAAGGGPPGRWQGLGLIDVRGEILTPGQGQ